MNKRHVILMALLPALLFGCYGNVNTTKFEIQLAQSQEEGPIIAEASPSTYANATAANQDCTPCELVKLSPKVPKEIVLGQEYQSQIDVIALENVANVEVISLIPEGSTYVRSVPPAVRKGNKLVWNFDSMDKEQIEKIHVWFKGQREGQLVECFAVSALPRYCFTTLVGKASLEITKQGPSTAQLNEDIAYKIVVRNTGSAVAENVVVTDRLPDGLEHSSGKRSLVYEIGDLEPGASKTIDVSARATRRGEFTNVASAKSSNAGEVTDQVITKILQRQLQLDVDCPQGSYLGKRARSSIIVTNPGDSPLTNVVIVAECDEQLKTVSNSGNPQVGNGKMTWRIPTLAPGQKISHNITSISKFPGRHCCKVTVTCAEGLKKTAECCTEWKGFPAILLEVIDTEDPLLVGEETTYEISVTNQGTANDLQIRIVAQFPKEISPVSTSGATRGTINGKKVEFSAYPVLKPKQEIIFKIRAKAVSTGDSRLKIDMFSSFIKKPVREEESTHVY